MNQFDIYFVDLNPTIGREQKGKRPVLIFSNNYENLLDVITIIPITSRKDGRKIYPNEVFLETQLEKPSILLCQQIRTISKKRLIRKLSAIEDTELQREIIDTACYRFKEIK
jgi:mRNA interferase MazF